MINDFGVDAYCEARRREHEASSDAIAKDWGQIALAVARKMSTRIDVDPSTRVAMNAVLAADRDATPARIVPFDLPVLCSVIVRLDPEVANVAKFCTAVSLVKAALSSWNANVSDLLRSVTSVYPVSSIPAVVLQAKYSSMVLVPVPSSSPWPP